MKFNSKYFFIGSIECATIVLAMIAFLTATNINNNSFLWFVGIVGFAEAILFSISGWLSFREQEMQFDIDLYSDEQVNKDWSFEEKMIEKLDLSSDTKQQAYQEYIEEKNRWKSLIDKYEMKSKLGNSNYEFGSALFNFIINFTITLIILLPYFFYGKSMLSFFISALITIVIISVLSIEKSKKNGEPILFEIGTNNILAAMAAIGLHLIGILF